MTDVKGEPQPLREEELRRDDVFRCGLVHFGSEGVERRVVVFCLGGEEQGARHDGFGVVGHWAVVEVESFEVLYCCRLYCCSYIPHFSIYRGRKMPMRHDWMQVIDVYTLTFVGNEQKSANSIALTQ